MHWNLLTFLPNADGNVLFISIVIITAGEVAILKRHPAAIFVIVLQVGEHGLVLGVTRMPVGVDGRICFWGLWLSGL